MTGTSCKKVMSESLATGTSTVHLKYTGVETALEFKVHDTCHHIDEKALVMQADPENSVKI